MTRRKALRIRKARWTGICALCGAPVIPPARLASVNGGPWMCVSHVAGAGEPEPGPGPVTPDPAVPGG
jgi:hypothetical protein